MRTTKAKPAWRRTWVIGLALLSFVLPMVAGFLRQEPAVPFADPARVSYYRQTVTALVLGIACAVGTFGTFVGTRALLPAWVRWLSVGLASLGVLISAYLLWSLIGTCGPGVIWGRCTP